MCGMVYVWRVYGLWCVCMSMYVLVAEDVKSTGDDRDAADDESPGYVQ